MSVNQKIDKLTKPQLIELAKKMNAEVCIKTGNLSRKDLQDTIKQMNDKIKVDGKKLLDNVITVPGRGKELEREAKLGEAKRQRKLKQIDKKQSEIEVLSAKLKKLQKEVPNASGVLLRKKVMEVEKLTQRINKLFD